jgi:hypothetical protein
MVKKGSVFWDSPLKTNTFSWRTCRLHPHGRRINQGRNQHEAGSKQSWRRHAPPKRPLTFNGLRHVTSLNTEIFQAPDLPTGSCRIYISAELQSILSKMFRVFSSKCCENILKQTITNSLQIFTYSSFLITFSSHFMLYYCGLKTVSLNSL